jgi:hypothetical protein
MNPEVLQLAANFAGIIIVVKMLSDSQKEAIAHLSKASDASMKSAIDAIHDLKEEIKGLRQIIVDIQIRD